MQLVALFLNGNVSSDLMVGERVETESASSEQEFELSFARPKSNPQAMTPSPKPESDLSTTSLNFLGMGSDSSHPPAIGLPGLNSKTVRIELGLNSNVTLDSSPIESFPRSSNAIRNTLETQFGRTPRPDIKGGQLLPRQAKLSAQSVSAPVQELLPESDQRPTSNGVRNAVVEQQSQSQPRQITAIAPAPGLSDFGMVVSSGTKMADAQQRVPYRAQLTSGDAPERPRISTPSASNTPTDRFQTANISTDTSRPLSDNGKISVQTRPSEPGLNWGSDSFARSNDKQTRLPDEPKGRNEVLRSLSPIRSADSTSDLKEVQSRPSSNQPKFGFQSGMDTSGAPTEKQASPSVHGDIAGQAAHKAVGASSTDETAVHYVTKKASDPIDVGRPATVLQKSSAAEPGSGHLRHRTAPSALPSVPKQQSAHGVASVLTTKSGANQSDGPVPLSSEVTTYLSEELVSVASEKPIKSGSVANTADLRSIPTVAKADLPQIIISQLSEGLPRANKAAIEVQLAPEELGRVRLSLSPTENGMVVQVQADREVTLDLIRRHIDLLAQDLRGQGHQNLMFSFGGGHEKSPDLDSMNITTDDEASTDSAEDAEVSTLDADVIKNPDRLDIRI